MAVAEVCKGIAKRVGWLAGKGHNVMLHAQRKVKDSANLPEKIQTALFEKLSRTLYKQAQFMVGKITERMEVIDKVAGPFYEKVNELSRRGPVTENQLWQTLHSIEASKHLSEEEKTLLVKLFGQTVNAQKSKVVDAVVVDKSSAELEGKL